MTTIPDFGPAADAAIDAAIARFPKTFGLRAFPGKRFTINRDASFVSGGQVWLYTYRIEANGSKLAFAKGTPGELLSQIVEAER